MTNLSLISRISWSSSVESPLRVGLLEPPIEIFLAKQTIRTHTTDKGVYLRLVPEGVRPEGAAAAAVSLPFAGGELDRVVDNTGAARAIGCGGATELSAWFLLKAGQSISTFQSLFFFLRVFIGLLDSALARLTALTHFSLSSSELEDSKKSRVSVSTMNSNP